MQPADIARIVTVSSPRVSPDGRQVAFVVRRVDTEANGYRSAVWLADVDGGRAPFPLTGGEHDGDPTWSPDGSRLAFTRRTGSTSGLCVVPVGGPGETVTVCEREEAVEEVAFSPDGRRIAFVSRERAARYSEGDDERARPPRLVDRLFSRLDGVGWIIDRPATVFVVAADGTSAPRVVAGGPYEHSGPAWAPDGRTLAVSAARGEDWDLTTQRDIHLVDVDGPAGEPRQLTRDGLSHSLPAFSPDGRFVASLAEDVRIVFSFADVMVTEVATGERHSVPTAELDLLCAPFPGARSPVWVGDELVFAVEHRGEVQVRRVPVGGGAVDEVLGGTRVVEGFDVAGGTLAFTASSPSRTSELFVLVDGRERRLTDLGAAFLADVPPVVAEHFTVPSPAGDDDVDAWLVRPPHPVDAASVPLLVSIHGGPMAQYGTSWFDEFQLWAGAGYAVVYCNPHGSTGRSQAWARAIRSPEAETAPGTGWGGIDADDVLAVLDAVLAREPVLDAARVGVLGGSYGGYLTSWLVGHSDRFAAACSERAVNNMESEEWSSDCAGLFHWEIGPNHLDRPDVYRRISPVSYAKDITTPMLILHSENDLRCHVEQADALFVALRVLGRPVEYWRFPEEDHGLSRTGSPRHRVQRAEIILDWFGRHLGGRRPEIGWAHPSRDA